MNDFSKDDVVLSVDKLMMHFGGIKALSDVSLKVKRNSIFALIGPNGAGKTTLVKAVLGLLKPTSGRVWRKPKLRIGYMPQKLHVDPTLPLSVLRFLRLEIGRASCRERV